MSTHLAAPKPTYYSKPVYASSDETAPKPEISRTPSPTPSEQEILSRKNTVKEWFSAKSRKEWLKIVLVLVVVVAVIILIEAFHDKIINALKPVSNWLHGLRAGWLIPIAVLIVLSIPPFFGQGCKVGLFIHIVLSSSCSASRTFHGRRPEWRRQAVKQQVSSHFMRLFIGLGAPPPQTAQTLTGSTYQRCLL
ncbi:hypothetical protein FB45DRAFT_1053958 [Roridomyces roridus]|uniref:Uncharacterized protein n=1 Tax=Roridomyces roridus TaxID=1738132 RepID=A0AAD7C7W3_9AGAR|nr:hypothetical protein FB45DRAFT_1053958 [Roridomyces roridus]